MMLTLIAVILWLLPILGFGSAIARLIDYRLKGGIFTVSLPTIATQGFLGLLCLSVLGNVANFFIPLSPYPAAAVAGVGMILFAVNCRKSGTQLSLIDILVLALCLLWISAATQGGITYFDTGLYHLASVRWLTDSK